MATAGDGADQAVVTFGLGALSFGLAVGHVAEIVPNAWMDLPPGLGPMVAGILDLGGVAVTVLAADRLLGLAPMTFGLDASILIMRGQPALGLLTGQVQGVVAPSGCRRLPVDAALSFHASLAGQLRQGDRVIHLLDWQHLLLAEERARIAAFDARRQARLAALEEAPESPGTAGP